MTKIMKSLFDMMNLQSLYEIVLNSCLCECVCCSYDYGCKCHCYSKEIDHPPPDNELVEILSKEINIPIVSLGGIASLDDMKKLINSGASAVAAGSFFCFYGPHKAVLLTYPNYEEIKSLFS